MRVDLYSLIHKAQRHHMLRLADALGQLDGGADAALHQARTRVGQIIAHLREHAHNEETYIHPLLRALGEQAAELEAEHGALEAQLAQLESRLDQAGAAELYASFNRFLGHYLLHLDAEERTQRELLWVRYEDAQLGAVMGRFKAGRSPAAARADLEFMLPALSAVELERLFQGIKAAAPPAVFQGACRLAERTRAPPRWQQLRTTFA
jgi:hemerythrin-like domain-containing protein